LYDSRVEGTVHDVHVTDMPTDPTHVTLSEVWIVHAKRRHHAGGSETDDGAVEYAADLRCALYMSGTVELS
jgi:hypothetical protein